MLRSVFDAIPSLVFVVDDDVRIQEYNAAVANLLAVQRSAILKRRAGTVLHCLHSLDVPEGCGRAPICEDCVIRNSVTEAFRGSRVVRRRTRIEIIQDENKIELYALITTSPFRYKERLFALLVIEDISEIAELQRIIPICQNCRKIRDEKIFGLVSKPILRSSGTSTFHMVYVQNAIRLRWKRWLGRSMPSKMVQSIVCSEVGQNRLGPDNKP